MTEDLVKFVIPARFVLKHATPDVEDIAYGYDKGWLDEENVIRVAEGLYAKGLSMSDSLSAVSMLLSDETYKVRELLELSRKRSPGQEDPLDSAVRDRLWLYLALRWLHENPDFFKDPLQVIEELYADFGYPDYIEGLVRFVPSPQGEVRSIEQRWEDYLLDETKRFGGQTQDL